jgi:hypothetical protein
MENNKMSKPRRFLLIGIGVFSLLWVLLWMAFPFEWYVFFMSGAIGSNFYILAIAFIVTVLSETVFSRIWRIKIPFLLNVILQTLTLVGSVYIYSIFFYSDTRWIVPVYLFALAVMNVVIVGTAKDFDARVKLPLIRRKPPLAILYGVILTFTENLLTLMIFVISKNIFVYSAM